MSCFKIFQYCLELVNCKSFNVLSIFEKNCSLACLIILLTLLRTCLNLAQLFADGCFIAWDFMRSRFRVKERIMESYQGLSLGRTVTSLKGILNFINSSNLFVNNKIASSMLVWLMKFQFSQSIKAFKRLKSARLYSQTCLLVGLLITD